MLSKILIALALTASFSFSQTVTVPGCAPELTVQRVTTGTGANTVVKLRVIAADSSVDTGTALLTHQQGIATAKLVSLARPTAGGNAQVEIPAEEMLFGDWTATISAKLSQCAAIGYSRPLPFRVPVVVSGKNLWATSYADDSGLYFDFPQLGVIPAGNSTAYFQDTNQDVTVVTQVPFEGAYYDEVLKLRPSDPPSSGYVSHVVPIRILATNQVVTIQTPSSQYAYNPSDFFSLSSALVTSKLTAAKTNFREGKSKKTTQFEHLDKAIDVIE